MPSDDRTPQALQALLAPRDVFRSAVATTLEEVRGYIEAQSDVTGDANDQLAAELGFVGAQHLDLSRLTSVVTALPTTNHKHTGTVERAFRVLAEVADLPDDAFVVTVPPGGSLVGEVASTLANLGRAAGAGRVVDFARSGRYRASEHKAYLEGYPFARWGPGERQMAPPLVVEVEGCDLLAPGLAQFLDGDLKLVLLVRGDAPPAALVRLITPGVFVAQSADLSHLDSLAAWEGSGIAAVMSASAARFLHDPATSGGLAARLTVSDLPASPPKRPIGSLTVQQLRQELEQLQALSTVGVGVVATGAEAQESAPADPADKLAAWLLTQADLSGVQ